MLGHVVSLISSPKNCKKTSYTNVDGQVYPYFCLCSVCVGLWPVAYKLYTFYPLP